MRKRPQTGSASCISKLARWQEIHDRLDSVPHPHAYVVPDHGISRGASKCALGTHGLSRGISRWKGISKPGTCYIPSKEYACRCGLHSNLQCTLCVLQQDPSGVLLLVDPTSRGSLTAGMCLWYVSDGEGFCCSTHAFFIQILKG